MKMGFNIRASIVAICCMLCTIGSDAQISISQGGIVDIDCAAQTDFTDSDASSGNYDAGENLSITICPDLGNASRLLIDPASAGHTWDIASTDNLFFYDGADDTAPLLGTYNTFSHPNGVSISTTLNNPSGCMTIVFSSSTSSTTGAGWTGWLFCGLQWQPFEAGITSDLENPELPGYADICQNTEITLTCIGDYPFDGQGYEQSDATSFFSWDLGNGDVQEGFGLNSITNTFDGAFGYFITCSVTDDQGQIEVAEFKVRVSTNPSFAGTTALSNDSICLGNEATFLGGIGSDSDQTFGFNTTPSAFVGGGFFGEQQYLEDGTGINYETTLNIDDFPAGAIIENVDDIVSVCVNLEHSYLGDLEMLLRCPDGTEINIFNSFPGAIGIIPGGFNGTGTFLGNAYDANQGNAGEGFTYCFNASADWTLGDAFDAGNTVEVELLNTDGEILSEGNAMAPGNYLPEEGFENFLDCPINGPWTLIVRDNIGTDDGFIFNWSIQFNPLIDPTVEFYSPVAETYAWQDDPTITFQTDTFITVLPPSLGSYDYVFNMTDDFGCSYDTTLFIEVVPHVDVSATLPACSFETELQVNNSFGPGFWNYSPSDSAIFLPEQNGEVMLFSGAGEYHFEWTDAFCSSVEEIDVYFRPFPEANVPDSMEICLGIGEGITVEPQPLDIDVNYAWQVDTIGGVAILGTDVSQEANQTGVYTVTVQDAICTDNFALSQTFVVEAPCIMDTYNVFTPNNDGDNDTFEVRAITKFKDPVVMVYNRWGNLVFEKENYQNDWDMEELSDGTYFFVVLNPQNNETFKGHFTLLR